ncbi:SDR family oxidoreductase [Alsobacter sp. KACC 23698]|uniref:SDR family oxidoreductase n=1 Tax=Alsobacter sp. KACC 23698 TaxID=3149229 RepID=A0AAU7JFW7_9HYPH
MNLLVFGYGYTASAFIRAERKRFTDIAATVRTPEKAALLGRDGVRGLVFDAGVRDADPTGRVDPEILASIAQADALLVSIPPDAEGDPVLRAFGDRIGASAPLRWIGYLSTVGVYGDHGGEWVDEKTPLRPVSERSARRVHAEEAWLALGRRSGKPVHVFRLSGIYGPGQNALVNLQARTARRLVKPGQVFNRIHVEDIAGVLAASLERPGGGIYNVTDDEPAPPQDVVTYAAGLLGVQPPPEIAFETAHLSPMARSFYGENKRVANRRVRDELGYAFRYPTYREGMQALAAAGEGRS